MAERTRDLGRLDGPVLAFGGPYSNLQATEAVLAEAARRGISPGNVVCTGDVVAYCADPRATVDLVRGSGIHVVAGNCEEQLGTDADDCGCGFEPGTACEALSVQWYPFARERLDDDAKAWMRGLPGRLAATVGGRRLAFIHGGVEDVSEFVFASANAARLSADVASLGVDGVVGGHAGIPFARLVDGRLWLNAGAVGMPANDGTSRTWYALLSPAEDGLRVEIEPLDYDAAAAARRMRDERLPEGYARCLETGLWPSLDVLPPAERAATGRPLAPSGLTWPDAPRAAAE